MNGGSREELRRDFVVLFAKEIIINKTNNYGGDERWICTVWHADELIMFDGVMKIK